MKKLLLSTTLLAFAFQLHAQKPVSEFVQMYQESLVELADNISSKTKEKSWKDVEPGWKENVAEAKKMSDMCDAVVALADQIKPGKGIKNTWPGKKNGWAKDCAELKSWNEFGGKLLEFADYLEDKAWDDEKGTWVAKVNDLNDDFLKNEKLRAPEVKIDEGVFQSKYKELVNGSVDGIDNLKKGDPSETEEDGKKIKHWRTPFMLPAAAGALVDFQDKYGVHRYVAYWNAGTSKPNAEKIRKQIADLIEGSLPANYIKKEGYSRDFHDNKKVTFEWNSEKFADVQKRPSMEIGIEKVDGRYRVIMFFSEAYYKNQFKPEW